MNIFTQYVSGRKQGLTSGYYSGGTGLNPVYNRVEAALEMLLTYDFYTVTIDVAFGFRGDHKAVFYMNIH